MANTVQLTQDGNIVYPITDVSCVMGLDEGAITEAVLCWDGASTPVVANIPAGVVVTYNSTTYTGTLAASADTVGKIYMVATGTSNNYDRYMTFAGSPSYVWQNIGDTTIDLSSYATKAEVDELEAKVDKFDVLITTAGGEVPYIFKAGKTYIVFSNQATTLNVSTRITQYGSTVDGPYSLVGFGSIEFTATTDAYFLRFSKAFDGYVYEKDSVAYDISILKPEVVALENHIEDTDERVNDISSLVDESSDGFVNVGYLNTKGIAKSGNDWRYTDFIRINTRHPIFVCCDTGNSAVSAVAFYAGDAEEDYISSIINVATSGTAYEVPVSEIPYNAKYIRLTTAVSVLSSSYCRQSQDTMDEVYNQLQFSVLDEKGTSFSIVGYVRPNGTFQTTVNTYRRTDYLPINTVRDITAYGDSANVNLLFIAFYKKTGEEYAFISGLNNTGTSFTKQTIPASSIPAEATHIVVSTTTNQAANSYVFQSADTVKEEIGAIKQTQELFKEELKTISSKSMGILWNVPKKIYVSSDTQIFFYTDVLCFNPAMLNIPAIFRFKNDSYISRAGYDVVKNVSSNTTKTFQLLYLDKGTPFYDGEVISEKAVDFVVKSKTTGTQNVLVIGDSFIDSGFDILDYINGFATDDNITINWVGTHTNSDGQHCEAYAGWSEESFFGNASPFMLNGNFDFSNYVNNLGASIDKVVILLGSNMPTTNPTVNVGKWIQKMISGGDGVTSSIRDALPAAQIFVCLCMPYLSDAPSLTGLGYATNRGYYQNYRMLANSKYIEYFDGVENDVFVIPMLNFHPNYGYIGTDIDGMQFNLDNFPSIRVPRDIHPTASGAKCIAYNIYNYLKLTM